MRSTSSALLIPVVLGLVVVGACTTEAGEEPASTESAPAEATAEVSTASQADSELAGTSWEMVEIQSMDDNSWVPEDPARYTLTLAEDGSAQMQLDCNQGRSNWTSSGAPEIGFGPVASTSALCQDDGLSERYAAQFEFIRSYVLRDGHLFLATMADGAIIEFRPAGDTAPSG